MDSPWWTGRDQDLIKEGIKEGTVQLPSPSALRSPGADNGSWVPDFPTNQIERETLTMLIWAECFADEK